MTIKPGLKSDGMDPELVLRDGTACIIDEWLEKCSSFPINHDEVTTLANEIIVNMKDHGWRQVPVTEKPDAVWDESRAMDRKERISATIFDYDWEDGSRPSEEQCNDLADRIGGIK